MKILPATRTAVIAFARAVALTSFEAIERQDSADVDFEMAKAMKFVAYLVHALAVAATPSLILTTIEQSEFVGDAPLRAAAVAALKAEIATSR